MRDYQVLRVFPYLSYPLIDTRRCDMCRRISLGEEGGKRDTASVKQNTKHSTYQTKMVKNGLTNSYSLFKVGPGAKNI